MKTFGSPEAPPQRGVGGNSKKVILTYRHRPKFACSIISRHVDMIYIAPPHKLGALGTQSPWIVPPHVGCRAKFGRSRSNCVSISTGVQNRERWSPVSPLGWDAVNNLSWHAEFDGTSICEKIRQKTGPLVFRLSRSVKLFIESYANRYSRHSNDGPTW